MINTFKFSELPLKWRNVELAKFYDSLLKVIAKPPRSLNALGWSKYYPSSKEKILAPNVFVKSLNIWLQKSLSKLHFQFWISISRFNDVLIYGTLISIPFLITDLFSSPKLIWISVSKLTLFPFSGFYITWIGAFTDRVFYLKDLSELAISPYHNFLC